MRIMESYANNRRFKIFLHLLTFLCLVEKLVKERTGMLEEANARADKLLTQLLPRLSFFVSNLKIFQLRRKRA